MEAWKEYLLSSVFLMNEDVNPITLGLARWMLDFSQRRVPELAAAAVVTFLPVIIILFLAQNLLIKGIVAGAVKQ